MAEAPSLGEIESIVRDPGAGRGPVRPLINTQEVAHAANQAAQFKAENDWRKYTDFQKRLTDQAQQLGEIQGLDVAQADRPALQKEAADIFEEIGNDPQAALGGKKAVEIQEKIGKLRSRSTQSVQDKVYDDSHRAYLDRDPSLQTDDNKKIMEGYFKQPLGQRNPYTLKLPSLYNPEAIAKQINDSIPQKFSQSGLSPDGKYINTTTGIRYDEKQYKTLADQMFYLPDSRGIVLANQVADRFKALPQQLQDAYKQKYPDDPVKGFYDETVMPWRKKDEITKTDSKADPIAIQKLKHQDKLQELNVKFGYDKILEGMKIGGSKEVVKFREDLKNKSKKEQVGAVSGLVDKMIQDAFTGTPEVGTGLDEPYYDIPASPKTLGIYSHKKGGISKDVEMPDKMMVNEAGDKVRVVYYKKAGDPSSGIDEKKTNIFSTGEFKVRALKDMIGTTATEKEINADDDTDEEGSTSTTVDYSGSSKTKIPGF